MHFVRPSVLVSHGPTRMHVGRNNRNFQYDMNGSKLQVVNSEKDLGVIITDDGKVLNNAGICIIRQ